MKSMRHIVMLDPSIADFNSKLAGLLIADRTDLRTFYGLDQFFHYMQTDEAKRTELLILETKLDCSPILKQHLGVDISICENACHGLYAGICMLEIIRGGGLGLKIKSDVPTIFFTAMPAHDPALNRIVKTKAGCCFKYGNPGEDWNFLSQNVRRNLAGMRI